MKCRKRIVHLVPSLEIGGSEMSQLRMLPMLNDEIESIFVTIFDKGSLAEDFNRVGIKVISVNQNKIWDLSSYFRLKRIMTTLSPDLVITHLIYADLIGRFFVQLFLPCKVISSLATTYNFPKYWIARLFERTTKYFCAGYVANAQIVKKTYVEKFKVSEEKIKVLTTGMDTEAFRSLKPDEHLRRELGIKPTDIVIVCVASLYLNKGHTFLLSAFEQIYQKRTDVKLIFVGEGKERVNLQKQIVAYRSRDAILFLGKRLDVPKLLALSHIFVLPTFFEGMSNAIMEAMACGLAVVTSNIPENRELVTNEESGLLCPIKNIPCLVQSIERLLNDKYLAETVGRNARKSIEERYNLNDSAERMRNFYFSIS